MGSRREASLIGFVFKLLDGDGRGLLNEFIPTVTQGRRGCVIRPRFDFRDTTKHFDRSIEGQFSHVWEKIPKELINSEEVDEWQQLTKNCQRFLTGKKLKKSRKNKR